MAVFIAGAGATLGVDTSTYDFSRFLDSIITTASPTLVTSTTVTASWNVRGSFTYPTPDTIDGVITGFEEFASGVPVFSISGIQNVTVLDLAIWSLSDQGALASATIFAFADQITGSAFGDDLYGWGGADSINGMGGYDLIFGGSGNDVIDGGEGASYLRGDDGNDRITGGSAFDDINGNMGNDTGAGGAGADWVVGGKDNDLLSGELGDDIVYGNLGDDWCDGGDGADIVRGGQEQDVVLGQAGDDWLSGDRGSDTITGGAGADIFHTFGDAGLDRVTDFNRAEGDRVMLDPGTTYTVSQQGADTVIAMGGGGQMVLVGVSMTTLTGAWIFGA